MAEELQGKDALVSCLGGSGSFLNRKPVSIYTNSAEVFAAAMRRSGVSRLIVFSAWHMAGNPKTGLLNVGLGAKMKYMGYFVRSLHPSGRKRWLLFSVRDMSGGLRNLCFTKFYVVNFL